VHLGTVAMLVHAVAGGLGGHSAPLLQLTIDLAHWAAPLGQLSRVCSLAMSIPLTLGASTLGEGLHTIVHPGGPAPLRPPAFCCLIGLICSACRQWRLADDTHTPRLNPAGMRQQPGGGPGGQTAPLSLHRTL